VPLVAFAQIVLAVVMVGVEGLALTVTSTPFVAAQLDAFVTVSVRCAVPAAPAVQVMFWMLVALVIVPPVIDQAHVVAAGPLALLPVEAAQTALATVIAGADGVGLIVMFLVFVAEQPEALVTMRVSTVGLEALVPALQVMFWMFAALVIVPLEIDQAHVVAAGPLAVLPVEPSQTALAAVIAGALGLALMVTLVLFDAEQPLAFVTVSESWTVPDAPAV
jgi:hypothetical protein